LLDWGEGIDDRVNYHCDDHEHPEPGDPRPPEDSRAIERYIVGENVPNSFRGTAEAENEVTVCMAPFPAR
jgi:hypothetical protein